MKLDELTFDVMQPLVGTSFWAEFPNDTKVELRALETRKVMESAAARLPRAPFSVFFLGPLTFLLKQSTYLVNHDTFRQAIPIFLVPVGQQADGYVYEAVFS